MNEFIIVFRESLEACLIVGIIYTLLEKNNLIKQIQQLWAGVGAAIIASIIVAIALNSIKESIGNESYTALFEGIFMYITAGLLWYVIFWLSKHVSDRTELENETKNAMKASGWGVFLVVFFAILREGFETAIFLMGSFSMTGSFSYMGFILGMILAIMIGYFIVIQGRRINLKSFLVKGDRLEWVGLENKSEINRVWDIYQPKDRLDENDNSFMFSYNLNGKEKYTHLLHDKGRAGVFLKGFLGYNSNPNWIEFLLWILSLILGLKLWRQFYFQKS